MRKKITLSIDALVNLALGILLLLFNPELAAAIGVPNSDMSFYPNILGGVLIGIAVALIIEAVRKDKSEVVGLGLVGAISINICGGIVLVLWLIFGGLNLPVHGKIFLWSLSSVLLIISGIELFFNIKLARHGA